MRRLLALPLVAAALLLAGCAPTVALTPAPDATSVGCAGVIVRLPQAIVGAARRATDAQGTAAWGTPASVTLTCGVGTPAASSLQCFPIGGIDWLVDDRRVGGTESAVFTTYGRTPGVRIVVATDSVSRSDVLPAVSDAIVAATRSTGARCVSASDLTATPTPSATP